MLTFVIPTWNRPAHLEISACSTAEQAAQHEGVRVLISDHGSDEETQQVIARLKAQYACVDSVRLERAEGHDYSHSFRFAFAQPQTEWTWMFGDDDALEPHGLDVVLDCLKRDDLQFLHVSEASRTRGTRQLAHGKLIDLCNAIGWLDMTGFITGNIVRTKHWRTAAALPTWDLYAKNAFAHACALLEVLHDQEAAFFDWPVVRTQEPAVTEETMARWNQFNVGLRYHYIDEAFVSMRNRGIIGTLKPKFFRYLSYYLWDRFIGQIANSYNTTEDFQITDYIDGLLRRSLTLTTFLAPAEERRFAGEILELKEMMVAHSSALQYAIKKAGEMGKYVDDHSVARFEFEYLPERASAQTV